jgi:hypothetical protein
MSIGKVDALVSSENLGTEAFLVGGKNFNVVADFNAGSFVGTVTAQRRFIDKTGTTSWIDVEDYTEQANKQALEVESNVEYRLFVKTGNYTSGTVYLRLSR